MGMKVRFHGQVEWHLPLPDEAAATQCGISLADANTFSYTFRQLSPEEVCGRCLEVNGPLRDDETDPRIAMDRE